MTILSKRMTSRTRWGLIVMATSLLAFLGLGAAMLTGVLEALDRDLLLALRGPGGLGDPVGSRGIEEAVRDLTALGGTTLVAVTTVAVSLFLLAQRQGRHAVVLAGVVLLAWLTKDTAKHLFGRARPDLVPHEVFVSSASFPSGHTTMGTALILTLAVLASRYGPSGRGRLLIYGSAVLLAGLVGFSRVYLGVHWPSDVVAGWCLGVFWAATAWVVLSLSGKSAEVR
jgi:undecaprenyl-diphosphatase